MIAYRATNGTARHGELNNLVTRKLVNGTTGEEVLGKACTAEDLEEYGDGRLVESIAVDLELESGEVEDHVKVDVDISSANRSDSRSSRVSEGVEVGLEEGDAAGRVGGRVGFSGSDVTENGRVETTVEAGRSDVGVSADPVIAHGLVGIKHERVALAGENLDAVDGEGLGVDTVRLDNGLRKMDQLASRRPCMLL